MMPLPMVLMKVPRPGRGRKQRHWFRGWKRGKGAEFCTRADSLRQQRLHAETAAAGFFELGGFDDYRGQPLLMKNRFQRRRHIGSEIAAVDDDAIAHEAVSLFGGEQVNSFPEFVQRRKSVGRVCPWKDQGRFVAERAEASVEVVAIRID